MKILLMDIIKPSMNDASTVHKMELIANLANINPNIYVISYGNIEINGVHVYLLKENKIKTLTRCNYLYILFKSIITNHFDILYTRNGTIGGIGYIIKTFSRSKIVFESNGIMSDDFEILRGQSRMNLIQRKKMELLYYIDFFSMKKSDAIIAVTDGIKSHLVGRGIFENKIFVIENGANIDIFTPATNLVEVQELKKQYNIYQDESIVLFVGNFAPWQGLEYLLNAVPIIIRERPKTKFFLVGDGIIKENLMSMASYLNISKKIIFTGTIPYRNIPKYINMADVCVAPFIVNRNEKIGLSPLKIYEYMACGKPIVASNIKGVGDLLETSNSGIPITPNNSSELAKAIIRLLKNKQLGEQMGNNGRKLLITNYNWATNARKTIEVFKKI